MGSGADSTIVRARKTLRAELRAARRAMTPEMRVRAAQRVARHAARRIPLHPGQRVALYAPLAEELDTGPLAQVVLRHGGRIYLPRIVDRRACRMRFIAVSGAMRRNCLGILEPEGAGFLAPAALDLVFVPLVGFDDYGMRLGMGAGYYDRAFAFLNARDTWRRPRLIGVGYSAQHVAELSGAPHDVRLDTVITEDGVINCRRNH